jgi:hypothetical protein
LRGFGHPAKHVLVPPSGQEDNAATVSKLDAVPSRFILMPMIVADSQCFKSRAVAGFKQLSVFSPAAFVFFWLPSILIN